MKSGALSAGRLGRRLTARITRPIRQTAAIVGEDRHQVVHPLHVGTVMEGPPFPTIDDQSGVHELLEMERQSRRGNVEPLDELRGRIALRAALYEQSEDSQTRLRSERA